MKAWTSTVQGGPAPGEGAMKEPGGRSRGRCRHGQVQGGLAPVEGAMEEPGAGVGAGAGLDRYRVVQNLVREPCKSQEVGLGAGADLD